VQFSSCNKLSSGVVSTVYQISVAKVKAERDRHCIAEIRQRSFSLFLAVIGTLSLEMAVALKTVSSFGRLASVSGASARVWCGIEASRISQANASFFKDQESSFSKSKNSAGFSQSTDLPARCQAAVVACPLPTRQAVEVLERPIELEKLLPAPEALRTAEAIEQHAAPLPRSFLVESVNGNLVECSSRGSRPLYTIVLAEFQMRYMSQTEVVVEEDHSAVKTAFEAALATAPDDARLVSEFAMFTWKALGDLDAAEELYNKAVALAPHDADIQASHALFLWQCDE